MIMQINLLKILIIYYILMVKYKIPFAHYWGKEFFIFILFFKH